MRDNPAGGDPGGGIEVFADSHAPETSIVLNGLASIRGSTTDSSGGGIYIGHSNVTVTLRGWSSVTRNKAGTTGGGIDNNAGSMLVGATNRVRWNDPDDCSPGC